MSNAERIPYNADNIIYPDFLEESADSSAGVLAALEAEWRETIRQENLQNNPVAQHIAKRGFVSTSNGRGRNPRKDREVRLVGSNQPEYIMLPNGQVKKITVTRFQSAGEDWSHPGSDSMAYNLLEGSLTTDLDPHTVYLSEIAELPPNHNPAGGVHPWSKVKRGLTR